MLSQPFFSQGDKIFDKPFSEWIVTWWNKFFDNDMLRNMGKVYCLPGYLAENSDGQTRHDYKIKRDKAILFSPMNFINPNPAICQERMDAIAKPLAANVDGKSIADYIQRVTTKRLFWWLGKAQMFSDGFWIFLPPNALERGKHTIDTYNTCSANVTKVNLLFNLEII